MKTFKILKSLCFSFLIVFLPQVPVLASGFTVPDSTRAVPAFKGTYIVKPGDTYYSLSRSLQIPIDSLRKWTNENLQPGQEISAGKAVVKPAVVATAAKPKPAVKEIAVPQREVQSTSASVGSAVADVKDRQRVMVIPFDPYLYFSDADDEIARNSKIPRQNVRHAFRNRLNAFLDPEGFETIHLLGGVFRDSVNEINKLYRSLSYNYQDILYSKYNPQRLAEDRAAAEASKSWLTKAREKVGMEQYNEKSNVAEKESKYFGVKVKSPDFYSYFNKQYEVDYYIFINQFEVSTDYTNCLDRAALNYERDFLVHYSIFNNKGEQIAGNKVNIHYKSNSNDVQRIVGENMQKMANKILADLPPAK